MSCQIVLKQFTTGTVPDTILEISVLAETLHHFLHRTPFHYLTLWCTVIFSYLSLRVHRSSRLKVFALQVTFFLQIAVKTFQVWFILITTNLFACIYHFMTCLFRSVLFFFIFS